MSILLPIVGHLAHTPAKETDSLVLDRRTYAQAERCIHCGLCLPACPTYLETGHEAQSPRGRIDLMRGLSDGTIEPTAKVRGHLDACLDCRGCETACPSGVVYHELIEETRDRLARRDRMHPLEAESRPWGVEVFLRAVLTRPTAAKWAVLPVRGLQWIGLWELVERMKLLDHLPAVMKRMVRLLPAEGKVWPGRVAELTGAHGVDALMVRLRDRAGSTQPKRWTVGMVGGCVGGILNEGVNRKAVDLLAACGVDVFAPSRHRCCGALHLHGGDLSEARELARSTIELFPPKRLPDGHGVDFVVSPIAGCGAALKQYGDLLRDDPLWFGRAREFSRQVRDISELLVELPLPEMTYSVNRIVAYHGACHLAHAQKVTAAPRDLLGRIPGLKVVELAESDLCCGAAGSYNLTEPEMAGRLAARKLGRFFETGAEVLVAGNIGCTAHLAAAARAMGREIRIVHPVELVHEGVFGRGG